MRLTYKHEKSSGYGSVKLKNLPPDPLIGKIQYLDEAWEEQRNKLGQLEDIEDEFEIDSIEDLRDRLSKYKFLANHKMSCVDIEAYNLMLNDLNLYHTIEKELGIDLITLFKASKNGIYVKNCNFKIIYNVNLKHKCFEGSCYNDYGVEERSYYYFKDYGKTWSLTKEELL